MTSSPITFCISTFNNLNYLKLAVKSIRAYSYYKDAPLIVYSENSDDGTDEWIMKEGKKLYNVEGYIEKNEVRKGIGGGMNFCAERVKTEYIMFLHADFFVSKDWDINALKLADSYDDKPVWVSSYRIQPNVFKEQNRPGTIFVPLGEFGEYYNNFDAQYFVDYAEEFSKYNDIQIRKGEGVSGLIKKKYWNAIGGNDPLFNPAYYDDYDLFIRMQLSGYQFVLTSKSVVYHFGSRASRFPDDDLTKRKPELENHERNGFQKWMKKWGEAPKFDNEGFIIPIAGTNNSIKI